MLNDQIYQQIFDLLSELLPTVWEKIVFYLEYGEASYSAALYVKIDGSYIDGVDLPGVYEDQVFEAFDAIDELVLPEREAIQESLWTNMTMCVDNTGHMRTDFDYSELSESGYKYQENWKKKYLS